MDGAPELRIHARTSYHQQHAIIGYYIFGTFFRRHHFTSNLSQGGAMFYCAIHGIYQSPSFLVGALKLISVN